MIADSWEFARSQARGTLVMMLSDDDALVHDALARFAEAHRRHGADFLFCNLAEYRDQSFLGPQQNTVSCRPFSGTARVVSTDEFVRPLFAFRPKFDMHPSAFMFSAALADRVVQRTGRFFQTNGVEYFAWPLAAVLLQEHRLHRSAAGHPRPDGEVVGLDHRPLESWEGADPEDDCRCRAQTRDWIPLTNFTLCNLMAEGMLLGKQMFPDELGVLSVRRAAVSERPR